MRKLQLNTHIHWATGTHQRFRGGIIIIIIWHGGGGWPPSLRGTHAHREIHGRVGDHDKWLSRSPPPLSGGRAARVFGQVFGAICQPVRGGGALGERVASDTRRKVVRPVGHKRVHGTLACIWFEVDPPTEPSPCIMCATLFSASGFVYAIRSPHLRHDATLCSIHACIICTRVRTCFARFHCSSRSYVLHKLKHRISIGGRTGTIKALVETRTRTQSQCARQLSVTCLRASSSILMHYCACMVTCCTICVLHITVLVKHCGFL